MEGAPSPGPTGRGLSRGWELGVLRGDSSPASCRVGGGGVWPRGLGTPTRLWGVGSSLGCCVCAFRRQALGFVAQRRGPRYVLPLRGQRAHDSRTPEQRPPPRPFGNRRLNGIQARAPPLLGHPGPLLCTRAHNVGTFQARDADRDRCDREAAGGSLNPLGQRAARPSSQDRQPLSDGSFLFSAQNSVL